MSKIWKVLKKGEFSKCVPGIDKKHSTAFWTSHWGKHHLETANPSGQIGLSLHFKHCHSLWHFRPHICFLLTFPMQRRDSAMLSLNSARISPESQSTMGRNLIFFNNFHALAFYNSLSTCNLKRLCSPDPECLMSPGNHLKFISHIIHKILDPLVMQNTLKQKHCNIDITVSEHTDSCPPSPLLVF